MNVNKLKHIFLALVSGLILAGCQGVTPINSKPLKAPSKKVNEKLLIGDLSKSVRGESPNVIGYHTFTVFGIRTVPINAEYPPGMQDAMTKHLRNAIKTAGYTPVVVPPDTKTDAPVLRGEITKFWYSSYWWFWPVTIVGGDVKMTLYLEDPDGKVLWTKNIKGGAGMVLPSFANVDFLIEDSVTKVCNQLIEGITSSEFQQALGNSHPSTVAQSR